MFVANNTESVPRLWHLVFQDVWLTQSLWTRHLYSEPFPDVDANDLGLYVMVIKSIKVINRQQIGAITACIEASLSLRPWAVSLWEVSVLHGDLLNKTDRYWRWTGPVSQ